MHAFAELPYEQLVARYRHGPNHFHASILQVPDEALDTFFRPEAGVGRWSVRAVIGHLADVELLMTLRLRRMIAEPQPVLGGFDEHAYLDADMYRGPNKPIAGFLATIVALRSWCGEWLATLDAPERDRRAMHPEAGEIRFLDHLAYHTWHLEHHARFVHLKLRRLDEHAASAT